MMQLKNWQLQAYKAWQDNCCRGIVEAATGSGKSFLFLQAIKDLSIAQRTLIIVPTIQLAYQHAELLKKVLEIPECHIGFCGDGQNLIDRRIVIGVINSIRVLSADVLNRFDLVVMDECHHYWSDINGLVIKKRDAFLQTMLLTATFSSANIEPMYKNVFPVVFKYSQSDCIKDGVINNYELINVSILIDAENVAEYEKADAYIKHYYRNYKTFDNIKKNLRFDPVARNLMRSIGFRRKLLSNGNNRIAKTAEIILESPEVKTIVFGEYVGAAKKLYALIKDKCKVGIYHSNMKLNERQEMLEKFFKDDYDCIVSVRCLNEGLNVPSCERAIIMSGNSVQRDFLQRVGRVLRKSDKGVSKVFQLYIRDSKDLDWLQERIKGVDATLVRISWV